MATTTEHWVVCWNGLTPDQLGQQVPTTREQAESMAERMRAYPRTYEDVQLWRRTITVSDWETEQPPAGQGRAA